MISRESCKGYLRSESKVIEETLFIDEAFVMKRVHKVSGVVTWLLVGDTRRSGIIIEQ